MSSLWFKNGVTSVIIRLRILDTTSVVGAGKTGLTSSSAGLIISTIADNEASATTYTQAGSTIDTITTLGTFAAPTSNHCRFKEVDSTNFPGIYEVQIADARWGVSGARSLMISIPYVSGLGIYAAPVQVRLSAVDPQDATAFGLADLDTTISSRLAPAGTLANVTLVATTTNLTNAPPDSSGVTTLLGRLTSTRAGLMDSLSDLDAAISTRMATFTLPTNFSALVISGAGAVDASLKAILGTVLTETSGQLAGAFKKFFNIATPASTMDHLTLLDTVTTATTATNLTNAPGAGDFTSTMKTSLNAATPAVTVSDKTGFSLSSAGIQAIWDRLTSALTTVGSIGKLLVDDIDAAISSRSTYAGGDTSGTTTLLSRIASAITITGNKVDINDKTGFALTSAYDAAKTASQAGDKMDLVNAPNATAITAIQSGLSKPGTAQTIDQTTAIPASPSAGTIGEALKKADTDLDATVSSRLASSSYTAPDNADIVSIKAKTDNLPSDPASESGIIAHGDANWESGGSVPTVVQIRQEMDTNSTKLASINTKTTNLPADPASESSVETAITSAVTSIETHGDSHWDTIDLTSLDAAVAAIPTNPLLTNDARITDIKTKVDALPSDPASESEVETAITASQNILESDMPSLVELGLTGQGYTTTRAGLLDNLATLDLAAIASAVWDSLTSDHTVAGSFGVLINTIYSRLAAFVGVRVQINSGLSEAGALFIDQGADDSWVWTSTGYPDLAGATLTFLADPTTSKSLSPEISLGVTTSYDSGTGTWTLTVTPTHTQSATWDSGRDSYRYKIKVVLASGMINFLERGLLTVDKAVT